jgi:hypothetical protein
VGRRLKTRSTSACCTSTCPAWCATWPARPTRTRLPTSALAERGIADEAKLDAGKAEEAPG